MTLIHGILWTFLGFTTVIVIAVILAAPFSEQRLSGWFGDDSPSLVNEFDPEEATQNSGDTEGLSDEEVPGQALSEEPDLPVSIEDDEEKEPESVPENTEPTDPGEPLSPTPDPVGNTRVEQEQSVAPSPLYAFPPSPFEDINMHARTALVNIFCQTSGNLAPISGSGVIIDPRGVVLTNAHIGQYVLLQDASLIDITCSVRFGSPAANPMDVRLLYLPSAWVEVHAQDIVVERPLGTGENDYALLFITDPQSGAVRPETFPHAQIETREAITNEHDTVLVVSYPAGFLGGYSAEYALHHASSISTIGQVFTFSGQTIDLLSLGGIIVAQGGSSGGAVMNVWNHLVGLIVTSSDGDTTAERDLRAITISHIERSLVEHEGFGLSALLNRGAFLDAANTFRQEHAPALVEQFMAVITQ